MINACLLLGSSFPSQQKMFPTQLILGFCNCLYLEPSGKTLKQSIPHSVFLPLVFGGKGTEMSFFPLDELTVQIKFQNGILLIFGRLSPLQITVITWVQAFQRQKKAVSGLTSAFRSA